jgi:hypothetical protein
MILASADDVKLLIDNRVITNTSSKEVGLEVNREKTKYTLVSRDQNADQNHEVKTASRSYETVSQFKYDYLGTTVTNQNCIQEEIERRLNSGNVCCH